MIRLSERAWGYVFAGPAFVLVGLIALAPIAAALWLSLRQQLPILRRKYHIQTLGVFGSYVRGTSRPGSDLDLLVEFTQTPSLFEFVELEQRLSRLLGVKVDLVMRNTLKPLIGRQILNEDVGL